MNIFPAHQIVFRKSFLVADEEFRGVDILKYAGPVSCCWALRSLLVFAIINRAEMGIVSTSLHTRFDNNPGR